MNFDNGFSQHPIIIPFFKMLNGVQVVMWDYTKRAYLYEQFVCMSDEYAEYVPVRFEKL